MSLYLVFGFSVLLLLIQSFFMTKKNFYITKKIFYVLTSSFLMLILFLIFVTKLPGRPVRDASLYGLQCRICSWEGLNFSSFVLNRILELSRKRFTRTRKHLASDIFATREFMTPRQRGQRERQKGSRFILPKQQLHTCISLFCTFLSRRCTTTT